MVIPVGPSSYRHLLVSQALVVTQLPPAVCTGDRRTHNASIGVAPLVGDQLADLPYQAPRSLPSVLLVALLPHGLPPI
jgi:hypothetical protein